MLHIDRLDHVVLTVQDIDATCSFYCRVLGLEVITFGEGRKALRFGNQKINLHQLEHEIAPHAYAPTAGSADLCLVTQQSMDVVLEHLEQCQVCLLEGPVQRTGTLGDMLSVYFRDLDGNLIEVSTYSDIQSR